MTLNLISSEALFLPLTMCLLTGCATTTVEPPQTTVGQQSTSPQKVYIIKDESGGVPPPPYNVPDPSLQASRRDAVRRLNLRTARLVVIPGSVNSSDAYRPEVMLSSAQAEELANILDDPASYYEYQGVIACVCDQFRLNVSTDSERYTSVFCSWCRRFWVSDSSEEVHRLDTPLSKEGAAKIEAFFQTVLKVSP